MNRQLLIEIIRLYAIFLKQGHAKRELSNRWAWAGDGLPAPQETPIPNRWRHPPPHWPAPLNHDTESDFR
jgi:hypothetical protein